MNSEALLVQEAFTRDSHGLHLYFSQELKLIKIPWRH